MKSDAFDTLAMPEAGSVTTWAVDVTANAPSFIAVLAHVHPSFGFLRSAVVCRLAQI